MTDDKLLGMSEAQIRDRYRDAPAYYLQAKLEKRRTLQGPGTKAAKSRSEAVARIQPPEPPSKATAKAFTRASVQPSRKAPVAETRVVRASANVDRVDVALPGFEILDAVLSQLDDPPAASATGALSRPEPSSESEAERTQQAILEATLENYLEDYSSWPIIGDGERPIERAPEPRTAKQQPSELERRLARLLESEPELELVLESEAGLAPPDLSPVPDNVTVGAFGSGGNENVHVVSVAMDRKRPYMVRVIGKTTRCAG